MPTLQYEGRTYHLKTLILKCLRCGTVAETSKPYPDHAYCECRKVHIDGGISAGATITGNPWQMEEVSIFRTQDAPKLQLPQEVVTAHHNRVRQGMLNSYRRAGLAMTDEEIERIKSKD